MATTGRSPATGCRRATRTPQATARSFGSLLYQNCVQTGLEDIGSLTISGAGSNGVITANYPLQIGGGSMDSGTISLATGGDFDLLTGTFDMKGGAILAPGGPTDGGAGSQVISIRAQTTSNVKNTEQIGAGINNNGTLNFNGCTCKFIGTAGVSNGAGSTVNLIGAKLNVSDESSTGEIDNFGSVAVGSGTTTSYLPITNEAGSGLTLVSGSLDVEAAGFNQMGISIYQKGGYTNINGGLTLTAVNDYQQEAGNLYTRNSGTKTTATIVGDVQIAGGAVTVATDANTYGTLYVDGDYSMGPNTTLNLAVLVPSGGSIPTSDYSSVHSTGTFQVATHLGTTLAVTTSGRGNIKVGTSTWTPALSDASFPNQFDWNGNGGYNWTLSINGAKDVATATNPPAAADRRSTGPTAAAMAGTGANGAFLNAAPRRQPRRSWTRSSLPAGRPARVLHGRPTPARLSPAGCLARAGHAGRAQDWHAGLSPRSARAPGRPQDAKARRKDAGPQG